MKKIKEWLKFKFKKFLDIDTLETQFFNHNIENNQRMDFIYNWTNSMYKILKEDINLIKEKTDNINNNINSHKQYINNSVKENEIAIRKIYNTVENIVNIGTDVHRENSGHSWAVICIEGNMNIVKFIDLDRQNAREILDFLKHFEVGRHCIDTPYKEMFYNGLFKF